MKYITTTELRTKSKELVETLREGESVVLIHRSRQVGVIAPPVDSPAPKIFDAQAFLKIRDSLDLDIPASYEERDAEYRQHMMEKYGHHSD